MLRETKAEVKKYREGGVQTVDMEAAALFVVAKYRKVKMAAAFFASDVLGDEWEHIYKDEQSVVKEGLETLVDIAVDCLRG